MESIRLVQHGYYQVKPDYRNKELRGVPLKLMGYYDKYSTVNKDILKVCHFNPLVIGEYAFDLSIWEKDIEPIPLTKEWLLKLGLTENCWHFFTGKYNIDYFQISAIKVDDRYGFGYYSKQDILTEIKYVHQLQNLYFARTGKELTIK